MEEQSSVVSSLLPECSRHESQTRKLSIDQVLQEWAGEFGPAQLRHFILVTLAWCLPCLLTFVMVFADRTPEWVCLSLSPRMASYLLLPHTHVDQRRVGAARMQDVNPFCTPTSSICSLSPSVWEWAGGKGTSTVSQWGLICDESYKVTLAQCLFFVGTMLGAGIWGELSDSCLGRKGVLIVTCCLSSLLCLATAFSPIYWVYVALRVATGVSVGGVGPTAFVLATEVVGPSKRGPASMSIFFFYSCTIIGLSAVAQFSSSWRQLYLMCSAPCILYSLLVLPYVKESPRWYLARGEVGHALAMLERIATKNKRIIPATITLEIEQDGVVEAEVGHHVLLRKGGTMDIFKIPVVRRRMLIMLFIWLTNGLSYYGLNLNVPNVGSNISLGLILNAVGEMPGYLITAVLLQKYGRRRVLVCALLLLGISCFGGALARGSVARTGCGMVAMFGVAAAYNMVFIYTAELFPTEVRNAAMGLASQAAQVGAVAAPLAATAASIYEWTPFTVFSIMAFLASCFACFLPETREKRMHETIEGMICTGPV